jgi:hypothetical protein
MARYGQEPEIITAFAGYVLLGHAVSILKESKWSDEDIHKSLQSRIDTWIELKSPSMKEPPNFYEVMECNKRIGVEIYEVFWKHEAYFNQLPGNGPFPHMVEVLCVVLRGLVAMVFRERGGADAQQFADFIKQLVSSELEQQIRDCQQNR